MFQLYGFNMLLEIFVAIFTFLLSRLTGFGYKPMKENKMPVQTVSRYGKFPFKAYFFSLIVAPIFMATLVIFKREALYFAILIELIEILSSFLTHYEKYSLYENAIVSKKVFSKKCIFLPKDLLLIVVKADVLSWESTRLKTLRKNAVEYDDRYMICICGNCSVDDALRVIHQYGQWPKEELYYNESIKAIFRKTVYHDFLYSFVYEAEQVQKLVENHDCQIIVPRSLEGKVDLSGLNIPIHVDEKG